VHRQTQRLCAHTVDDAGYAPYKQHDECCGSLLTFDTSMTVPRRPPERRRLCPVDLQELVDCGSLLTVISTDAADKDDVHGERRHYDDSVKNLPPFHPSSSSLSPYFIYISHNCNPYLFECYVRIIGSFSISHICTNLHESFSVFCWLRNVVKRGICYQNVCPSVCLSLSVCHTRDPRLNSTRCRNTLHTVQQQQQQHHHHHHNNIRICIAPWVVTSEALAAGRVF